MDVVSLAAVSGAWCASLTMWRRRKRRSSSAARAARRHRREGLIGVHNAEDVAGLASPNARPTYLGTEWPRGARMRKAVLSNVLGSYNPIPT